MKTKITVCENGCCQGVDECEQWFEEGAEFGFGEMETLVPPPGAAEKIEELEEEERMIAHAAIHGPGMTQYMLKRMKKVTTELEQLRALTGEKI